MEREEIIEFISKNPLFCLATIENGKPRVRAMMLYRADERGILFYTGKSKDLCRQLIERPEVEMCFYTVRNSMQVRIDGIAEPLDDLDLKKEIVAEHEFLRPWIDSEGYDPLIPFRVSDAVATVWTIDKDFAPKTYVNL